jgi:hypothetical protein
MGHDRQLNGRSREPGQAAGGQKPTVVGDVDFSALRSLEWAPVAKDRLPAGARIR